ncbi:hypothetical protein SAMN00017405_0848 [Desulfonispora thiosulfatigenes DSM 11270]|uniref:Uncharacterized protein n=1 Tax=Desulfonispora thiosulfatigenes DSM 11270 TaxID=656914 RepID=A0A1W1UGK7_DESTI|nr:hypothetical protein [Desulfonispora thiosulfatigenes]SMB80217.1 hypothetical protein SAMN00017405_0848 [Desulfonispora thiosulfatigenes DSM 11270]
MDIENLRESLAEYISFSDRLVYEMRDFKSDEYRAGVADGIEMAIDMLKSYLEGFPELDALKDIK